MSHTTEPDNTRRTVDLASGPMTYLDSGTGPAVLLLHGTLANADTWRTLTPLLDGQYRCIRPDLPIGGHSHSPHPTTDLSASGIAAMLVEFLVALDLDEVTVVANDTGGAYAQVLAAEHPHLVTSLVLSNCDALDVFPPPQFTQLPKLVRIPGYMRLMATAFRFKSVTTSNSALGLLSNTLTHDEIVEYYLHNFISNRNTRRDFKRAVRGWSIDDTQRAAQKLAERPVPTLLCWGTDDTELFPIELAHRLHEIFPDSMLATIDGSATFIQEDRPQAFADAIGAFIEAPRPAVQR